MARLVLVHEPEAACLARLLADGFEPKHAAEIASYLAQSTDIAPEFAAIEAACARRGLAFEAVELDAAAARLAALDPAQTLVWTLTDGIAYFRGGAAPALARLHGMATFGSDDSLFALCQDKFRSGAVLAALGLPVPPAGLARDGRFLVPPPAAAGGYFVKPNRLGAKIGIWPDSRCRDAEAALALSRRVWAAYRDDVVVQAYVPGRNARASFLAVTPEAGVEALGVSFVDFGRRLPDHGGQPLPLRRNRQRREGRRPLGGAGAGAGGRHAARGRPRDPGTRRAADRAISACGTCSRWICALRRTGRST